MAYHNGSDTAARPTVRDAADANPIAAAGVVNGSPLVAAEAAERVGAVPAGRSVRGNHSARNLRHSRTATMIALVVGDLGDPFAAGLAQAVQAKAQRRGALLVVAGCGDDPARERDVVMTLLDRGVDGLLLYPTSSDHGYLGDQRTERAPIVMLGHRPAGIDTDSIHADDIGGATRAVRHLLRLGHARVGLVGGPGNGATNGVSPGADPDPSSIGPHGRIEGYRRALRSAGLSYDGQLIRAECDSAASAEVAARDLMALPNPPTALFTTHNRMTVGVLRALGTGPGGIALVGFDDVDRADVCEPRITVVAPDPAEIGRRAARLMFDRLDGATGPSVRMNVPMRLIARGSGEVRRLDSRIR